MSFNWNKGNGYTLKSGIVIIEPSSILRGNVCRIAVGGYATQAEVTAIDASAEIGSRDYPYKDYTTYKAAIGTHGNYDAIIYEGNYTDENLGTLANYRIYADTNAGGVKCSGSGIYPFCSVANDGATIKSYANFFDLWFKNYTKVANYGGCADCIIDCLTFSQTSNSYCDGCLLLGDVYIWNANASKNNYVYNCSVTDIGAGDEKTIYHNAIINIASITNINSSTVVIWGGIITVGANTYDVSAAIGLGKSEATIQSEIGTMFGVSFIARIIEPPIINGAKGNFNFDIENYPTETENIIAIIGNSNYAKRGLKLEWNETEADSDYIYSATSPHYSASDGFSGLTCQNVDTDGQVTTSSNDAVWVSKIFTLSEAVSLSNFIQTGKLNGLDLEFDECYFRGVSQSGQDVEDYFNSTGYTCSYSGGVFTCDLPRFKMNWDSRCNKENNSAFGLIENGSYDLDGVNDEFWAGVIEFQLIFVKRGV